MRITPLTRRAGALLATALLAAACGSTQSSDTMTVIPLGGSDTDRYRWEVCRLTAEPDDPRAVLVREVSLGYADHERGLFTADHIRQAGSASENRIQLATQGDDVVSRQVFGTQPDTAFLRDFPFVARDTPLSVAQLRTRAGVLAAFGLDGSKSVELVDDHNFTFERFESMPVAPTSPVDEPPPSIVLGRPVTDVVWVLDIWSDARGTVQRLRLMTQDIRRSVAELRFSPSVGRWPVDVVPVEDVGCPPDLATPAPGWLGYVPYDQTLRVPLRVSLDPDGRPYDVVIAPDVELVVSAVGRLQAPDGTIVTMDAGAAAVDLAFYGQAATTVDLAFSTELDIELIEQVGPAGRTVVAVRLTDPARPVAYWGRFEAAGTEGNRTAITTRSVVDLAVELGSGQEGVNPLSAQLAELVGGAEPVVVTDLDGVPGPDTVVFSVDSDGRSQLSRGYDRRGTVVSVIVFAPRQPWRLMVPDGVPPGDVRDREAQMAECIAGTRSVLGNGECATDDT